MSPYASIALLLLVLSVAASDNVKKTTVNANVNWNKNSNQAVGHVNVNGKDTPFTVSVNANSNQPTFTIQSQDPAGKTTTVKVIPIKPITSTLHPQKPAEPSKPVHQDVPVPTPSAAPVPVPVPVPVPMPVPVPVPVPVPMPEPVPTPSPKPVVTVRTSTTFTAAGGQPGQPTVTVRSQTVQNNNEKPVTVTVVSVAKPEPVKGDPIHFNHPTPKQLPNTFPTTTPPSNTVNVATAATEPYILSSPVNCDHHVNKHHPDCKSHHGEKKRKGCNKRLWIKGIILGLAAFGALAFLALCCRICRRRQHSCCCRRRRPECEGNPTFGIPAPAPIPQQPVFVVQAQPVDPYFQPHQNTGRGGFVQLNETQPEVSANYVIGYPQPNEQPVYLIPQRN